METINYRLAVTNFTSYSASKIESAISAVKNVSSDMKDGEIRGLVAKEYAEQNYISEQEADSLLDYFVFSVGEA